MGLVLPRGKQCGKPRGEAIHEGIDAKEHDQEDESEVRQEQGYPPKSSARIPRRTSAHQ